MEANTIESINEINLEERPIVKIGTFNIKSPTSVIAKMLVKMGKCCLNFIEKNPVFSTFRIEIVPIDEQKLEWGYFLQVEPIVWFEYLCHKFGPLAWVEPKKNKVLQIARSYVDDVRNNYMPPLPPHNSQEESVPSNTYCARHAECLFPQKNQNTVSSPSSSPRSSISYRDQNKKYRNSWSSTDTSPVPKKRHPLGIYSPKIFCAKIVPQKNRNDRFCNWYAEDERVVLENQGWVVLSQQEDVRELLVCPHPGVIHEGEETIPEDINTRPTNHMNNKQLVVNTEFWTWVFNHFLDRYLIETICIDSKNAGHLPVELFALNFGSWESLEARDKQAKDCHGHLHVHITRSTVIAFENKKITSMYGKVGNPKQYGIQNCMELETRYLTSSEISILIQNSKIMNGKIDALSAKVDSLESKVDSLESKVDSLDSKVDRIINKLFPDEE